MSEGANSVQGPSKPVGPLSQAVSLGDSGGLRTLGGGKGSGGKGANPLIVLRRTAFVTWTQGRAETDRKADIDKRAVQRLLRWADRADLGQDAELIALARARRTRSLLALREGGHTVVRLHARVQWRLITGMGAKDNAHEIGIALHGTYGWPVLPASGLKGMAAAWAARNITDTAVIDAVFGTPRPVGGADVPADTGLGEASRGGVLFLDAFPTEVAAVQRDVLTPHAQPYYTAAESARDDENRTVGDKSDPVPLVPPAEHHNPVPVTFLTVRGATFAVDLVGCDAEAVRCAQHWLSDAADELGAGAKTSAGYGYLKIDTDPDWPPSPDPSAKG
ncbi:type III-B CRISPR module RAMP protein Cmr6 [Streptomyces triticisoli]|uniref:type III-B CRISPR module RAMP protein Cmr6 n=1 Tax=Streptomyces triticisoli TaxID=2182797 RepID=UPI001300313F|nr:type III-B CRISPR module RAMP protein Cmr6 [Streptomyces triticisoli]